MERNADGRRLIDKLQAMGVNTFHDQSTTKPGVWTSSTSRPVLIGDLAEAIRTRQLILHTRQAVDELMSFIRTEKHRDGEAIRGRNDDFVSALWIALFIRKSMPDRQSKIVSFEYKQKW